MTSKIQCALIGPGNIGTDLLYKLRRSPVLDPVWMVGIDPDSEGLKRAAELGLKTTADGVDGLLPHVLADGVQIAFDATSAYVHAENTRKLNALGVLMIDLTPAAIGPYCVPPVNLAQHDGELVATGAGAASLGHPLNAMVWLANTLGRLGIPLKAGEVILSGSLAALIPVQAGDVLRMSLGGIGRCGVRFG